MTEITRTVRSAVARQLRGARRDAAAIDDVTQEALTSVVLRLAQPEPVRDVGAYARRVADHACGRWRHRERRHRAQSLDDLCAAGGEPAARPPTSPHESEDRTPVSAWLWSSLPDRDRRVLQLVGLQQRTIGETSAALGLHREQVRRAVQRAKKSLRSLRESLPESVSLQAQGP